MIVVPRPAVGTVLNRIVTQTDSAPPTQRARGLTSKTYQPAPPRSL